MPDRIALVEGHHVRQQGVRAAAALRSIDLAKASMTAPYVTTLGLTDKSPWSYIMCMRWSRFSASWHAPFPPDLAYALITTLYVMVSGLTLEFPSRYMRFISSNMRWALTALSRAPLLAYA